jgi:hypothetical protein
MLRHTGMTVPAKGSDGEQRVPPSIPDDSSLSKNSASATSPSKKEESNSIHSVHAREPRNSEKEVQRRRPSFNVPRIVGE